MGRHVFPSWTPEPEFGSKEINDAAKSKRLKLKQSFFCFREFVGPVVTLPLSQLARNKVQ
jgi:hypothetical protein